MQNYRYLIKPTYHNYTFAVVIVSSLHVVVPDWYILFFLRTIHSVKQFRVWYQWRIFARGSMTQNIRLFVVLAAE